MIHILRILLAAALLAFSSFSWSQTRVIDEVFVSPNGCGAKDGIKVPDFPVGCEFKDACNNHDQCYSACMRGGMLRGDTRCEYLRCLEGGDLYGSVICKDSKYTSLQSEAEGRKDSCDAHFYDDMIRDNHRNPLCRMVGSIYKYAVVLKGSGSFNGMQRPETQKIINELKIENSPEQIDKLSNDALNFNTKSKFIKTIDKDNINKEMLIQQNPSIRIQERMQLQRDLQKR